jgi:hypothetical protein
MDTSYLLDLITSLATHATYLSLHILDQLRHTDARLNCLKSSIQTSQASSQDPHLEEPATTYHSLKNQLGRPGSDSSNAKQTPLA